MSAHNICGLREQITSNAIRAFPETATSVVFTVPAVPHRTTNLKDAFDVVVSKKSGKLEYRAVLYSMVTGFPKASGEYKASMEEALVSLAVIMCEKAGQKDAEEEEGQMRLKSGLW